MRYLTFSLFILLTHLGWAQAIVDVTIILKPEAILESSQVYLGDIATITTTDAPLRTQLQKVAVARAPLPGLSRHIYARQIKQAVLKKISLYTHMRWDGAATTKVTTARVTISRLDIDHIAQDYLVKQLQAHYGDDTRIQAESIDTQQAILLPTNKYQVVPRVSIANLGNQRVSLFADIIIDAQVYKTLPVWFTVTAMRPVPVLTRAVNIREVLSPHDFSPQLRNVAGIRNIANDKDFHTGNWRASTNLAAGHILHKKDYEQSPAVIASQPVNVSVKTGRVQLRTIGYAIEDGQMGDAVKVRNPNSEGVFVATVVGTGQVEIDAR